jgi:hypothetical protein
MSVHWGLKQTLRLRASRSDLSRNAYDYNRVRLLKPGVGDGQIFGAYRFRTGGAGSSAQSWN